MMKILKGLLVLAISFSALGITGCQKNTSIPEGVYKPTDPYKILLKVNGREIQIDEIKVNNDLLVFCLTVEQNDSTKKVETGLKYSLDNENKIVLYGSSNSNLYLELNSKYFWQYKNGAIEQLNPKDLSVVSTYSK
jgi:hypothetical protein